MEKENQNDPEVLCPFKRGVVRYGKPYSLDAATRADVVFGECDLWDCMAYIPPEKDRDDDGNFIRGKCALCVPKE